ncbi:MAG TPA: hypothetical protein PKD84_12370 [Propionicimonas sp.]|nr:hypothetical protein [Propionicimonas sp.]
MSAGDKARDSEFLQPKGSGSRTGGYAILWRTGMLFAAALLVWGLLWCPATGSAVIERPGDIVHRWPG